MHLPRTICHPRSHLQVMGHHQPNRLERLWIMLWEKCISERLTLFCNSSLMLSIDGSEENYLTFLGRAHIFSNPCTPPQVDTSQGLLNLTSAASPSPAFHLGALPQPTCWFVPGPCGIKKGQLMSTHRPAAHLYKWRFAGTDTSITLKLLGGMGVG